MNNKKKILIIMNGIIGNNPPISGGDVRPLEMISTWEKSGYEVHILSSESILPILKHYKIMPTVHILPNLQNSSAKSSFILRALQTVFSLPKSVGKYSFDIVYSTNDSLFDVFSALRLKWKNPNVRWFAVVHWIPPFPPWKRKRSSLANSILFFISERLSILFATFFADAILTISDSTAIILKKTFSERAPIFTVACGVRYEDIVTISKKNNTKKFDSVFMKRIQAVKGALDLVDIWSNVVKSIPSAKLLVIGTGSNELETLKTQIKKAKLENNIKLAGLIHDFDQKISYLCESKLLIHPSYEENWAIVVGEAMAAKLPVIAYKLEELESVWRDHITYVNLGNRWEFAEKISMHLRESALMETQGKLNQDFVKKYNWKNIARFEMKLFENIK